MNIMVSKALDHIDYYLKHHNLTDGFKELFLILKAELQVDRNDISPTLAVIVKMFIILLDESTQLKTESAKLARTNIELKSKVSLYSKQVTKLGEKIQKFKSQENRFYRTIDGMHEAMVAARKEVT